MSLAQLEQQHCIAIHRVECIWSIKRWPGVSGDFNLLDDLWQIISHCFCFTICKTDRITKKHIESYWWKLGGSIIYHIKCKFYATLFMTTGVNYCQSYRRPLLLLHRSSLATCSSSSLGLGDKSSHHSLCKGSATMLQHYNLISCIYLSFFVFLYCNDYTIS